MPDLDLPWGSDLGLNPTGDIAMVDGVDLDNQRIERRLLQVVKGYVFHQEFGIGLPQRIGRVALDRGIKAIVRAQLALEATVAPLPLPVVTVQFRPDADGVCAIRIDYTDAVTNLQTSIGLEVPSSR